MKTRTVFVYFPPSPDPTATRKRVKLDSRVNNVRYFSLLALTHTNPSTNVVLADIDECGMAVETEGLIGYPLPIIGDGNHYDTPLFLANCNRSVLNGFTVSLRTLDGSTLTHDGFGMWLLLHCQPEGFDLESIKAAEWPTTFSGAGTNDWRLDWTATQQEVDEDVRVVGSRFSKLNS